jgi:cob(I)alamin adenosyltransferase
MKIYTKTGDKGDTGLFNGERVSKADLRVEAYGTVDELNSIIGLARSFDAPQMLDDALKHISEMLFKLGTDLASPLDPPPKFEVQRVSPDMIEFLETMIDTYDVRLPQLKNFILPGGSKCAAYLHNARTVCRRAERLVVKLASVEPVGENAVIFLNRLSDYLFTAARFANYLEGVNDIEWRGK